MPNILKKTLDADTCASVVVSFESQWQTGLQNGDVAVFFRKKGPRVTTVDYVYAYLGSPVSGIIGRAKVQSVDWLSPSKALPLADLGKIGRKELENYIGKNPEVCVVRIEPFETFKKTIPATTLRSKFDMVPPQNYFFLSSDGKKEIDKLARLS